jgi:hypothetical protein
VANFTYTRSKFNLMKGDLDFDTADIRAVLVMTNTTADTEEDATTVAGFTTLDEFDGAGYSTGGVALTGEATTEDTANNRAEFDVVDIAYGALSAGTRSIAAVLLVVWGGSLGASIPLAYIDTVSGGPTFPFAANGGLVTIVIDAEGLIQVT